jgi:hypothetical protein
VKIRCAACREVIGEGGDVKEALRWHLCQASEEEHGRGLTWIKFEQIVEGVHSSGS